MSFFPPRATTELAFRCAAGPPQRSTGGGTNNTLNTQRHVEATEELSGRQLTASPTPRPVRAEAGAQRRTRPPPGLSG